MAAQISKLGKIFLVNGIENYNLDSLVFVIVSAVLGGYLGAIINNKLEEGKIEKIFSIFPSSNLLLIIAPKYPPNTAETITNTSESKL